MSGLFLLLPRELTGLNNLGQISQCIYITFNQSISLISLREIPPSFLLCSVCFVCDSNYLENFVNFTFLSLVAKTAFFC